MNLTAVDRWLARREPLFVVAALSVVLRVLYVVHPSDVLAPIDPWELGRSLWRGDLPYDDFPLEYPPGALPFFLLPGAVPRAAGDNVLALQSFAIEATILLAFRRDPVAIRRYLLASLFAVPLLAGGFDAVPVAAIAWSTVLLSRADARGWWVAALGATAKLFPGIAWGWTRRPLRVAAPALALTVAVLLAPLAVADADRTPIGYHGDRGVQNESVAASVTFLANTVRGIDNEYVYRFGGNELVGAEGAGNLALVVFGAAALAVAWRAHRRRPLGPGDGPLAALALLLLVLCGSKVLSPQFLALAGPLVALVGGRFFVAFLPVSFLTLAAFLADSPRSDGFVAVATVRNALLVALAVGALVAVHRSPDRVTPDGQTTSQRSAPQ